MCGPRGDAEIGAPRGVVRMDVVLLAAEGAVDDAALEMNRGDAKRLDDGESAPTLDSCGRLTAGACDSSQWWLTLLLMWLRREGVTKALSHIILGRGRQRLRKTISKIKNKKEFGSCIYPLFLFDALCEEAGGTDGAASTSRAARQARATVGGDPALARVGGGAGRGLH